MKQPYDWFSIPDCFSRFVLSVALFYYLLVTHPVSFTIYTIKYNDMYYGHFFGTLLSLSLPALPFTLCIWECFDKIKQLFKADWKAAGPGAIFFKRPPNFAAALFWDFWLNISM